MQLTSGHDETLGTFGQRMRAVRKARGIKLITCAKQIGLSRTGLYAWEEDGVVKPDPGKLLAFTRLADVSLDWLVEGVGPAPDLAPKRKSARGSRSGNQLAIAASDLPAGNRDVIPEIAATMTHHGRHLDLTPRAFWQMPLDVLEMGFHGAPGHMVVKRVATREGPDFGMTRGDYVLIDTSRNRIDEPGIYLLADPDGKCAKRAKVEWDRDTLRIIVLADDLNREDRELGANGSGEAVVVLGRIMAIFHPT